MFSLNGKKIILVRHAKAISQEKWEGEDFDRALSAFGRSSARVIGQYLRITGAVPDKMITSPAARTLETADIIMSRLGTTMLYEEYAALWGIQGNKESRKIYKELIRAQDESVNSLLIIGHNPEISDVLDHLAIESTPNMKTGSVAILALGKNMRWKDIDAGTTTLIHYSTPEFFQFDYVGGDE